MNIGEIQRDVWSVAQDEYTVKDIAELILQFCPREQFGKFKSKVMEFYEKGTEDWEEATRFFNCFEVKRQEPSLEDIYNNNG